MYNGLTVGGSIPYSIRESGADYKLSEHFRLIEFQCRDGSDLVLVHPRLVSLLEAIRSKAGPLHINSGFRTASHNERIGGVKYSQHTYGMAADISSKTLSPKALAKIAESFAPGGLGVYPSFVHLDLYGTRRRWKK